jgi:hypothetical protein
VSGCDVTKIAAEPCRSGSRGCCPSPSASKGSTMVPDLAAAEIERQVADAVSR